MGRRVALIGHGAIGATVAARLGEGVVPGVELVGVMTRQPREGLPAGAAGVLALEELLALEPDLVVEVAGADAVAWYVPTVLSHGIDVLAVSSAALARHEVEDAVRRAAATGGACLRIASGAIGGLDALVSAREGGLDRVTVVQRKPPRALLPVKEAAALAELRLVRSATAREVALALPENANVAATVALAGLGFDATEVKVFADPEAHANSVDLEVVGGFGEMRLMMANRPNPDNPRSSVVPAMSVIAAIRRDAAAVIIPG